MSMPTAFLAILVTALPIQSKSTPPDKEKQPQYYPFSEGNKWQYTINGESQKILTIQIAKIEKIDGESLARVESLVDGKVLATEHLSATEKGLFRNRFNGAEVKPAVRVIKLPIKKGDAWETETSIGQEKVKVTCKAGEEDIEVAAGKFKTITIETEGEGSPVKVQSKFWFADGVGMVKQTIEIAGKKITLELEKYELAKPK